MAYTIAKHGDKYWVTSPKGKVWKTKYSSRAAAEKGVAYVESRFAGGSGTPSSSASPESPDTAAERKELGIPDKVEEEGW